MHHGDENWWVFLTERLMVGYSNKIRVMVFNLLSFSSINQWTFFVNWWFFFSICEERCICAHFNCLHYYYQRLSSMKWKFMWKKMISFLFFTLFSSIAISFRHFPTGKLIFLLWNLCEACEFVKALDWNSLFIRYNHFDHNFISSCIPINF